MKVLSAIAWTAAASAAVLSSLPAVPQGFVRVSPAQPDDMLKLWVSLKHDGTESLAQKALNIATPGHADYGQHLSHIELRDLTAAPSADALEAVTTWLTTEGVRPEEIVNDVIIIRPTVKQANALLGADFAWYKSEDQDAKLRTLSYSVPDAVSDLVRMIQPTTRFGGPSKHVPLGTLHKRDFASDFAPTVTPEVLRKLYNINYTVKGSTRIKPTAFASFNESALNGDFQRFQDQYLNSSHQVIEKKLVNGGVDSQNETADDLPYEANANAQTLLGVSHPIPILEYITGGEGPPAGSDNEPFMELLTYLLSQSAADLPNVLTITYGEGEQTVPRDYALEVCHMLMQLGARGVSILWSSGNSGPGRECVSPTDNSTIQFKPLFPASCPWVTAVGATNQTNPMKPANFSGGGFSTLWARPPWQDEAVTKYLAKAGGLNAAYINTSNRAYPDVAAMGNNVAVFTGGNVVGQGGTTVSASVFAGMVALLNDARASISLPPMGFLSPWLYNHSDAFHDLTEGKSFGCFLPLDAEWYDRKPSQHWEAVEGWDTVTGLGSPEFGKLLAAAAPGVSNS